MDEHRRPQGLGRFPERPQRRVVELGAVDDGPDLDSPEPQHLDGAGQLLDGQAGLLQRNRAQAEQSSSRLGGVRSQGVVDRHAEVPRRLRIGPVGEHDGNG